MNLLRKTYQTFLRLLGKKGRWLVFLMLGIGIGLLSKLAMFASFEIYVALTYIFDENTYYQYFYYYGVSVFDKLRVITFRLLYTDVGIIGSTLYILWNAMIVYLCIKVFLKGCKTLYRGLCYGFRYL